VTHLPALTPACGVLYTAGMWEAIYYIIAVFVALLIPFSIFFYEAHDVDRSFWQKACEAIQYQVGIGYFGLPNPLCLFVVSFWKFPVHPIPRNNIVEHSVRFFVYLCAFVYEGFAFF
jgi:hypothetical protein